MAAVAHGIIRNFRHVFLYQLMIADPAAGGQNAGLGGDGGFAAGILGSDGIEAAFVVNVRDGGVFQHDHAVLLAQGDHPLHHVSAALTLLFEGGNLGAIGAVENVGALFVQLLYALAGVTEKVEEFTGGLEGVVGQSRAELPIRLVHHLPQGGEGVVGDTVLLLPAASVYPPVRSTHGTAAKVPALFYHNHLFIRGFGNPRGGNQTGAAAA